MSLLKKGLKFVLIRKNIDFIQLLIDLQIWECRMWFWEYFIDEENDIFL